MIKILKIHKTIKTVRSFIVLSSALLFVALSFSLPPKIQAQDEIPATVEAAPELSPIQFQSFRGKIAKLASEKTQSYPDGTTTLQQTFEIKLEDDRTIEVEIERLASDTQFGYKVGDKVIINQETINDQNSYYIADYVRSDGLLLAGALFIALVIAISGWHGIRSLIGLASSFVVIFWFILPMLEQGVHPILVAIGGALFIMLVTFYLSHGFNHKTNLAVAGTFLSLVATGILSLLFIYLTKLTGFATEEAVFLQVAKGGSFNAQGLLLAGIIIGTLGVLDDITLSQASIVQELVQTNPKLSSKKLFVKAMNVGKDHIASLVNTLVLVYTGGSLPLLLLFRDSQISTFDLLNYEIIAEEIVRTLVGSSGLVLAVPLTTFLAVMTKKQLLNAKKDEHGHHHHSH